MNQPRATRDSATVPSPEFRPRILMFGIRCQFTEHALQRLLDRGALVVGVVLPGPQSLGAPLRIDANSTRLPMLGRPQTPQLFSRQPLFQVGSPASPETHALVASLKPDVIVVACYPQRLPMALCQLATLGALNVHPSRLPENRGPDPLFWAFKRGDGRFGVTVHLLIQRLDAGNIVQQREFTGWHGVTEVEVERTLARHGADLTLRSIRALATGTRTFPQDESQATYEGWPEHENYRIDTTRPASDAYNFVKGVTDRGIPLRVAVDGRDVVVGDALWYTDNEPIRSSAEDVVSVPCSPGILVARIVNIP